MHVNYNKVINCWLCCYTQHTQRTLLIFHIVIAFIVLVCEMKIIWMITVNNNFHQATVNNSQQKQQQQKQHHLLVFVWFYSFLWIAFKHHMIRWIFFFNRRKMIVCSIRFKHQIMVKKIECTLSWFTKAVKKNIETRKKQPV